VTEPTESNLDRIIEALDEDLGNPASAQSLLLSEGPDRRLRLGSVGGRDLGANMAEIMADPGLGTVRVVSHPDASARGFRWVCSCGRYGAPTTRAVAYEGAQAHFAKHVHQDDRP